MRINLSHLSEATKGEWGSPSDKQGWPSHGPDAVVCVGSASIDPGSSRNLNHIGQKSGKLDRPGRLVLAAAAAFLLGLAVYMLDRVPGSAYLLTIKIAHHPDQARVFGAIGDSLPSFAHVFAFGLLTAVALGRDRRAMLFGIGAWWLIDTLFEIGQHRALSGSIAAVLPRGFSDWPLLDHVGVYLTRGTFDPVDLLATALGALAAAVLFARTVSCLTSKKDIHS